MSNKLSVKQVINSESYKKRFAEILGKKSQGFISSVIQIADDPKFANVEPHTILTAAITAATLDLPINPSLGFAWIVPYKGKAQFQIGWKGYVQLALRTGSYSRINVIPVHKSQFVGWNPLTEELTGNFSVEIPKEDKIIGYVAYFKLKNGFEKTVYWTKEKVTAHMKTYSKAYKTSFSPWSDHKNGGFDKMACKTVLKIAISHFGFMSIDMQTAMRADHSVQQTEGNYNYIDNPAKSLNIPQIEEGKQKQRVIDHIKKATSSAELQMVQDMIGEYDLVEDFDEKMAELLRTETVSDVEVVK
jgi:recombination protein RecT